MYSYEPLDNPRYAILTIPGGVTFKVFVTHKTIDYHYFKCVDYTGCTYHASVLNMSKDDGRTFENSVLHPVS